MMGFADLRSSSSATELMSLFSMPALPRGWGSPASAQGRGEAEQAPGTALPVGHPPLSLPSRFDEEPRQQDGTDPDRGQLLRPGRGVRLPALLPADRQGDTSRTRALHRGW